MKKLLDFLIKTRWWLLIAGVITFGLGIGWILLVLSFIGFVKNHSSVNKLNYSLPPRFDYPNGVKKDSFIKCPVCKADKIIQDARKEKLKNCSNCGAQFKETDNLMFKLSVKNCEVKYVKFTYANCIFSIYEWNTIALINKTLRENTLEQFSKGKVPNLSLQEIQSPITLKSKEHLIWQEQSKLHEPRAVRNYGGGSVRVAKGAYIRLGQAESHQEMRCIDSGNLVLTNARLVFSGEQRSSNIDLRKVLNITIYKDGFKVHIENRQKPQFFAISDPEFWQALLTGTMKRIS